MSRDAVLGARLFLLSKRLRFGRLHAILLQLQPHSADHRMPVFQPTKGVVMSIYTQYSRVCSLLGIPLAALLVGCESEPMEGQFHYISLQPGIDLDGDGVQAGLDCDERAASISPRAYEIPYDGIDQDCSGADLIDVDQDGVASTLVGGGDCDDSDPSVAPTRLEVANDGIDQDCSGADALDADGDGFFANASDCDDAQAESYPGALEQLDLQDNDCDGLVDEVPYAGVYPVTQAPTRLTSSEVGALFGFTLATGGALSWPETLLVGEAGAEQVLLLRLGEESLLGTQSLEPLLSLEGPPGAGVGQAPSLATDLNADGWPELLVAAPLGTEGGKLFVLPGEPWKEPLTLSLDQSARTYRGQTPYEGLGTSLLVPGDVTGDGYADVWVGAPGATVGGNSGAGAVYLLSGGPLAAQPGGVLAELTGFTLLGELTGLHVGASLSAGDLEGDGQLELVVGAPSEASSLLSRGGQVAIFRRAAGWSGERWFAEGQTVLTDDSADATRALGGAAVEARADLNGDGLPELVVAAPGAAGGGVGRGKVYIWWGGSGLLGGAQPFSSADVILLGTEDQEQLGAQLAALGDLNGDGVDELAVGAPGKSRVYLLYGRKAGWSRQAVVQQVATALVDPAGNGGLGIAMTGLDTNDDGKVELLMGAPFANAETAAPGGTVYVLPGMESP